MLSDSGVNASGDRDLCFPPIMECDMTIRDKSPVEELEHEINKATRLGSPALVLGVKVAQRLLDALRRQ